MNTPPISLAFLLGSPDISGGTYVIFEHATRLQEHGYAVTIITEAPVDPERYRWHPAATELRWLALEEAKKAENTFDLVIATWWKSPFLLHQLPGRHYLYFIQSIESRFFEEELQTDHDRRDLAIWRQYCESTYSLNLPVITEARWIVDYLHERYNLPAHLVRNGIRKDLYSEPGETIAPRVPNRLRVLIEGPVHVGYKNVPRSVELCRQAGIPEIWLLTSSDIEDYPGVDRVFSRVPIFQTPTVYRSCDVLVKLSYIEGMFGPPLEMFHCGGTAIIYEVTGHDEYIVHDHNSLVAPRDDDAAVIRYLELLKEDPDTLQRLKNGARQTAADWVDWDQATAHFAKALEDIQNSRPIHRSYLQHWTARIEADHKARLEARELDRFARREAREEGQINFVQFYCWAEEEGLQQGRFHWQRFTCGERTAVSCDMEVSGLPFWVRIDPSVRIGLFEIFAITITTINGAMSLFDCRTPEEFNQLYLGGTLTRLPLTDRNLFLSYGNDPQVIIPAVTEIGQGEKIRVTVELTELGITRFLHQNLEPGKSSTGELAAMLLRRIFQR